MNTYLIIVCAWLALLIFPFTTFYQNACSKYWWYKETGQIQKAPILLSVFLFIFCLVPLATASLLLIIHSIFDFICCCITKLATIILKKVFRF